jgi:hypothetical protein
LGSEVKTIRLPDRIEIDITQEDIDNGVPGFNSCPAALSLLRNLRKLEVEAARVYVYHYVSSIKYEGGAEVYQNPVELSRWIIRYDTMSPFRRVGMIPATFILTRGI